MPPVKGKMWSYSEENMKKAIQDVHNGISVKKAAIQNQVPRTTLRAKISGKSTLQQRMGPLTVLSVQEEDILEEWVKEMSHAGFPVTSNQLQSSVQHIIKECGRETPFTDGKPGKTWLASFLRRHPTISKRVAENLTLSRASITGEQMKSWFIEIELYLKEKELFHILSDPQRCFNGDETAFFFNPKGNRVLASKGQKAVYLNVNCDEKECLTVLVTASAAGEMAPPMIVFKYERIPANVIRSVPSEWGIGKSENGWMTQATFFEYVTNIFHPWLIKMKITLPVILFVDGHTSHLTLHLSKFCQENGIILIALYPNTTHFMQPMDVSVFKALKEAWKVKVHDWRLQHIDNPILKKIDFSHLLKVVLDETVTPIIVSNGFRKCGLVPWNPEAITVKGNSSDHNNQLSIDSKLVKSAVNVLEKFIGDEKLTIFKTCEPSVSWAGSIEDKSLFTVWKSMSAFHNRQDEQEEFEPMTAESSFAQEEPSIMEAATTTTDETIMDTSKGMVESEKPPESILDKSLSGTTDDINLPSNTMETEVGLSDESIFKQTVEVVNNEDVTSNYSLKFLPSPFKKCLVWPQENKRDEKKYQKKQRIPIVVSSDNYQAYLIKKQEEKLRGENMKRERAEERARKKKEKENIALKKKEMKATRKVLKKPNVIKKSKTRRKKQKTYSSSSDENDEWIQSQESDHELPPCTNSKELDELIDGQDLLQQAEDFCASLNLSEEEEYQPRRHLQDTELLKNEDAIREQLEEILQE